MTAVIVFGPLQRFGIKPTDHVGVAGIGIPATWRCNLQLPVEAMDINMTQRSVSGMPTFSPVRVASMLEFAARHRTFPKTEHILIAQVNGALLRAGKARYRINPDM